MWIKLLYHKGSGLLFFFKFTDRYIASGGIYGTNGAYIEMNGGQIHNNKSLTGGVYVGNLYGLMNGIDNTTHFVMNGGEIHHNENQSSYFSQGGGVLAHVTGHFTMNGGAIHNNKSAHGGGVAVNSEYIRNTDGVSSTTVDGNFTKEEYHEKAGIGFVMNGGEIRDNHAVAISPYYNFTGVGGGIYINSQNVDLKGGKILNNSADKVM